MENKIPKNNPEVRAVQTQQKVTKILTRLICGLSALLAAELYGATQVVATKNQGLSARMDKAIDKAIGEKRIIGTVVVVLQDGKIVYRRAAGLADREVERPMQINEIFRLASISKPIVSVAALSLVDKGRLNLNDPVTKYLPDFKPQLANDGSPEITIQQLLTHTAGLSYCFLEPSDGPYHKAGVSDGLDKPGLSMDEELHRIISAGLAYVPGTKWRYSVALDVLGAVIEKVTKESLPEAVKKLVTEPAKMIDTGFAPPDRQRLAATYADGSPPVRMSDPYLLPFMDLAGISYSPQRTFNKDSFPSGGGGMNGTAEDIARFLEIVRIGGKDILKPTTAESMLKNQIGNLPIINGPGWGFGYGGAVLTDPKAAKTPQSVGTWSWGGAWGHSWFVDPKLRLVVVALTNTAVEGMAGQFPIDIRDAVYGKKSQ